MNHSEQRIYLIKALLSENKNALFAIVNFSEAVTLEEIKDRSIMIESDIGEALKDLKTLKPHFKTILF